MPLLAGNRRGGGLGHSLLPSSSRPVRPGRKLSASSSSSSSSSRRRGQFRDLLRVANSTLFGVGLLVSLFFIIVFFRFGIPSHFSSTSTSPSSRSRHAVIPRVPRKTPSRRFSSLSGGNLREAGVPAAAVVDITTKDLYDRIKFRDVDGGAWKQGWEVSYDVHEWDSEKLKVFVVPHSHNDPGWKLTVEEYYEGQSRRILDTIVESLSKDDRRRFIWEEMSYLERWWREASSTKKESFTKLVKNGQLEIVGGGWVMNDEANSHYFAIIEQVTEGNMWLYDTIGVVPKNSWSIDPFGYSATMAYLLRRMGFQNMLIQRTHYELKKELALHKNLEYIWRQAWDAEETTDIFVHMMPFYSYDIPHTCGPEPAICCQFDFARMYRYGYEMCPWRQDPVETTQENLQERALKLLDQYKKKSTLYRTNTLLVPLGMTFFTNYQKLFDYINSNPSLNSEVKFGTLDEYFQTLRDEAERINYSRPAEVGSGELQGFPSLSGDFFTYADRQHDYWSGYYVSRPFFKAVDRILEQRYCDTSPCVRLPIAFSHKLTAARRNLALFQHHDGVTGTAKDHVVEDYGTRMHTSLQDLQIFMSKAVELLLGIQHEKSEPLSPSQFEPEQVRSQYDVQPVHRVLNMPQGHTQSVVFFNPLEQARDEVVMVIVDSPDVCVLQSNWSSVQSQVSPELKHGDLGKLATGRHRLYWRVYVPPLGLNTYYVALGYMGCEKAKPAVLKLASGISPLPCPAPYACSELKGDKVELKNRRYTLTFDVKSGLMNSVTRTDGTRTVVGEEIGMYSSSGSGAYLFKPIGRARPIVEGGGQVIISEGFLVNEFTRVYSAENTIQEFYIEKEYHVELIGHDFNDKELICRFKTSIDSRGVFYSDLNGFQMSRRETYEKIPLQGNYYPMPLLAFLQGTDGSRFSVHSRQALGAASLQDGWLEIMLDRRLVQDDGRGLGQGVMDNRPMNVVFHILTESNISAAVAPSDPLPLQPSLLSHQIGALLNYPIHAFTSRKTQEVSSLHPPPRAFSPLTSSFPCDLHIVSFKVPRPLNYSQALPREPRFTMILQRRVHSAGDDPLNLDIFKDLELLNARATSLNLMHNSVEMLGYIEQVEDAAQEGHALMSPMEIHAYKLEIRPQK
ncbi:unnamed protein product [Spirodela intermedia]|uniref:Alpha-mannosidase n=1 Tax=Spirodela intermedia TaxID=51605 RepID=A0A7I8IUU5_SPIIN|nr:unnamed protein product [Spirodela intermedia]CAA6661402.1 unnamed protein product [Spirodela intermedia]